MLPELSELYQEVIMDHNKNPRNFREMQDANHVAEGNNPLCGDYLKLYLRIEDNIIKDISFVGQGCAISKASASMMTQAVKSKTCEEAEKLFEEFHRMVTGKLDIENEKNNLGKLKAFAKVSEFPARVKCASLSWHTLHAALNNEKTASTE